MNMRELLRPRRQWWWIAAAIVYCGWEYYYALTQYNRRAHDPRAAVGVVYIDLAKLNYGLKYADLQSAGMFVGTDCGECDFSPRSHIPLFWGDGDQGLFGVIGKGKSRLNLTFYYYGKDVAGAKRRIDQSLEHLRGKFPGDADAIRLVASGAAP